MFPDFSFIFTQASHDTNMHTQINSVLNLKEQQQLSDKSSEYFTNQTAYVSVFLRFTSIHLRNFTS